MEVYDFMMMFSKKFRPLMRKDETYTRGLQDLIARTPPDVMERALESFADNYSRTVAAGLTPPLPSARSIADAVTRFTPIKSDRECMTCYGSGYVRCACDRAHNPIPSGPGMGTVQPPETVYIADFICPACRGREYYDYAMKEAVKRCCRSTSTGYSIMREEAYIQGTIYPEDQTPTPKPTSNVHQGTFPDLESVQRNVERSRIPDIVPLSDAAAGVFRW